MLPEGWIEGRVHDVVNGLESGVSVNGVDRTKNEKERAVLKISAITYGVFDRSAHKVIEGEELERAKTSPKAGQIIISRANTESLVGASAYIEGDYPDLFLPDKLWQTISKSNSNMKWLSYVLASSKIRYTLSKLATGTSGSMKNITKSELLGLKILIPSASEQAKIAKTLSTWDQAISTTERLIENSKAQKKSLMQQLLTRKRRLPGFSDEWQEYRFKQIFDRLKRKNTVGNDTVLTISGKDGLVSQRDYFNKRVASENLEGYTLLHRGDFAYNKSYSNGYPYGAIKPLDRYDAGVVSSLYICFSLIKPADHDHDYFRHYFEGGYFDREIYAIAQEGARNHGLLNVSSADFFITRLRVPSLREQSAIAQCINTAEAEQRNFEQQLDSLQQQKKALMQQLLTGKRRVKVYEDTAS